MSGMVACLHYAAPGGRADILLIMLPGAGIAAREFAEQGMVASVHEQGLAVEIIVAQPDMGLYLDDGVTALLHAEVIAPALARGVRRIWLLGISLGGMGALLYASAYPANIEGVVLLAPFIGTRGTTAELAKAGGLAAWSAAGSAATLPEQNLLRWLQGQMGRPAPPWLYLGYGAQDRFAPAHKMLADGLPQARVAVAPGGHDWHCWSGLWRELLARTPFRLDAARAV